MHRLVVSSLSLLLSVWVILSPTTFAAHSVQKHWVEKQALATDPASEAASKTLKEAEQAMEQAGGNSEDQNENTTRTKPPYAVIDIDPKNSN